MEKDPMVTGRMTKRTDMPPISVEEEPPYRGDGIYPEEEEMTNALWLLELMIHKARL